MLTEPRQKSQWASRIREVELLVDFTYHTPLCESIGLYNVLKVLEHAERLKVWKDSTQFHAPTLEKLRTIVEDDHLYASSEVEDTFGATLKWLSANVDERKAYLAEFLPLVRFSRCSVTHHEPTLLDLSTVGHSEKDVAELAVPSLNPSSSRGPGSGDGTN
ncbi:uncharacterized protein LOC142587215 [Dermacentor variabilis]|uniref:uncharacterized protein LOC142587215 n=1 Tax=Dermacentor variabilis TaxID=34621 RepID=UPI003F5B4FE4